MYRTNVTKDSCPYTLVYQMLMDAQSTKRKPLTIHTVYGYIQNTPGLMFSPGTTVLKVLEKMQNWHLIEIQGEIVKVIP
jgi:hypothetical protein